MSLIVDLKLFKQYQSAFQGIYIYFSAIYVLRKFKIFKPDVPILIVFIQVNVIKAYFIKYPKVVRFYLNQQC